MSLKKLIAAVERFFPHHDGNDEVWRFFLRVRKRWMSMGVRQYAGTHCFSVGTDIAFDSESEASSAIEAEDLEAWIAALGAWHKELKRDPLEAQARLNRQIPLTLRHGILLRSQLRCVLPDWCEFEVELGDLSLSDLEGVLTAYPPEPQAQMTLKRYLEYCRVAYEANPQTFSRDGIQFQTGLSGRQYYRRYADGRDGGLLQLPEDSAEAFAEWYKSKAHAGCHPWEIYRGGNSTHIDLAVSSTHGAGWQVLLHALSSTRLAETCRIAYALHLAKLSVEITDRESYLDRLREEDWVGIVPEGLGLRYSWHNFPKELKVADTIYLSWLLEEKKPAQRATLRRQLRHAIQWLPLRYTTAIRRTV